MAEGGQAGRREGNGAHEGGGRGGGEVGGRRDSLCGNSGGGEMHGQEHLAAASVGVCGDVLGVHSRVGLEVNLRR